MRHNLFKIGPQATDNGDCPFHYLESASGIGVTLSPEFDHEINGIGRCDPMRESWKSLPCQVMKQEKLPGVFTYSAGYTIAFPKRRTGALSKSFPDQFEWLPIEIVGEKGENFQPPFKSPLSEEVRALNVHLLHCIRPITLQDASVAEEFEPASKKRKSDVVSFADVETYAFKRAEVDGLDILFVEQDLALICTERFRQTLVDMKLEGLQFEPIQAILV